MKMDWLRTSLIAGIAIVCFALVIRWHEFEERNLPKVSETTITQVNNEVTELVPKVQTTETENSSSAIPSPTLPLKDQQLIEVKTDVLNLLIDPNGGDIVKVALPTYFNKLNQPDDPFIILNQTEQNTYIARSGLIGNNGTDTNQTRPQFRVAQNQFSLSEGQEKLVVDLVFAQSPKVTINKQFIFTRASHLIEVHYKVSNNSEENWQGAFYGQIKRNSYNPHVSSMMGMAPFLGASTSTNEKNYLKMTFDDFAEESFNHKKQGGWLAMVQHYFLSAWIPDQNSSNEFTFFKQKNSDIYFLQFVGKTHSVGPGQEGDISANFYVGPKDIRKLETISPFLDLTVDYSFLWWIAKPLFYTMDAIHQVVKNWGVAIILLTVLIKILFFYPSAASYKSMARMRKVQPKMQALKERYGEDKQKFSAEMMKLYRDEKVNPLGGCLPILIQMPVFLALYWVLMESVELRQAPFILWIQDLSIKDPYFVLPLIMGATMWIQQKLNPTPPDPMQAKIMQMMPIMFTFLFLFFPAGLVLYWVVNNTLSILQQWVITRNIEKSP
jgi:YidC/Oxa1 family membrane protein insertase